MLIHRIDLHQVRNVIYTLDEDGMTCATVTEGIQRNLCTSLTGKHAAGRRKLPRRDILGAGSLIYQLHFARHKIDRNIWTLLEHAEAIRLKDSVQTKRKYWLEECIVKRGKTSDIKGEKTWENVSCIIICPRKKIINEKYMINQFFYCFIKNKERLSSDGDIFQVQT